MQEILQEHHETAIMRLVTPAVGSKVSSNCYLPTNNKQLKETKLMKVLKAICVAAVLAISLSITTYADSPDPGIIHTPGLHSPATGHDNPSLPGNIVSPSVPSAESEDISSLALMNTLWIMLTIF
jgi:hypothetical protein